jgi:hypothetical protein
MTALLWASQEGYLEIAQLLIEAGANVNAAKTDDGTTALMLASEKGHLEIAQLLVERGANVNAATTDTGETALMMASGTYLEIVRLLLNNGADKAVVNNQGSRAIDHTGDPQIRALLAYKVELPKPATYL